MEFFYNCRSCNINLTSEDLCIGHITSHANQAERGNDVEMLGADGRKENAANASLVDGKGRRDANWAESGNDGEKRDIGERKEDAVNASP